MVPWDGPRLPLAAALSTEQQSPTEAGYRTYAAHMSQVVIWAAQQQSLTPAMCSQLSEVHLLLPTQVIRLQDMTPEGSLRGGMDVSLHLPHLRQIQQAAAACPLTYYGSLCPEYALPHTKQTRHTTCRVVRVCPYTAMTPSDALRRCTDHDAFNMGP
jgi:hypothetical protein